MGQKTYMFSYLGNLKRFLTIIISFILFSCGQETAESYYNMANKETQGKRKLNC